jgi:hypothetical protein
MLFFVSTSLRTTKKWWHLSHLTNRVELTKVSTWVHGSPHLGQVRTPLPEPDFLPPDVPGKNMNNLIEAIDTQKA